jgi:hypothetical protein
MSRTVTIVDNSDLSVPPLTSDEMIFVNELCQCLSKCPRRLEFLTNGDTIALLDREGARRSNLADGAARRDGVLLAYLNGPICHGVS